LFAPPGVDCLGGLSWSSRRASCSLENVRGFSAPRQPTRNAKRRHGKYVRSGSNRPSCLDLWLLGDLFCRVAGERGLPLPARRCWSAPPSTPDKPAAWRSNASFWPPPPARLSGTTSVIGSVANLERSLGAARPLYWRDPTKTATWAIFVHALGRVDRLRRALHRAAAHARRRSRGANRLEPGRFFLFNAAGGLLWAHVFGLAAIFSLRPSCASRAFRLRRLCPCGAWTRASFAIFQGQRKALARGGGSAIAVKAAERAS